MTNILHTEKWWYYSHKMVDYLEPQRTLYRDLIVISSPRIPHIMIFRKEPCPFITLVDDDDDEGVVEAASLIVAKGIKAE